MCNKLIYIN